MRLEDVAPEAAVAAGERALAAPVTGRADRERSRYGSDFSAS